jgi:alkylhydroperoxidase family enzyme
MSWIRETDAAVPAVIKCMSINPALMAAVQNLNANATFGSSALTRTQEEAIATVVSLINRCRY